MTYKVMQPFESQAKLFKVLCHPVRLAILEILRDGEQCVCHMEYNLGLRQAYISQHLMVLREAGIVQDRRDGLNIFYGISDPGIYTLIDTTNYRKETGQPSTFAIYKMENRQSGCACLKCQERNLLAARLSPQISEP